MRYLLLLLTFLCAPAFAQTTVENENTTATLIASVSTIKAGEPFTAAVAISHKPHWHTYWQNPGDAGIPTTLTWNLPEGAKAGEIQWPLPALLREGPLVVYAYSDELLLPVELSLPEHFSGETARLEVKGEWLVCKDICIPESAELSLELPVGESSAASSDAGEIASVQAALPKPFSEEILYTATHDALKFTLPQSLQIKSSDSVFFFPREENNILYAEPQLLEVAQQTTLAIAKTAGGEAPKNISGFLKINDNGYDIKAALTNAAKVAPNKPQTQTLGLGVLLLSALLGGLILNLMPCVLPVLSLKAFAIAKKAEHHRRLVVLQSLAYTAGVLVSFAVIAGLLIALQQSGEAIGWGFQMQSPAFVGFLIVLLFLIGLNLSGVFELPVLFGNVVQDNSYHLLRGSFLTGVLATAVATPCTAPFMATAVGAAITLSPISALLIFLAIGLGLALPFLLIAVFPHAVRFLPKPGAWMETFKQFLAFPMYGSVVWLLWVLTMQTGADGLLVILITLISLTFIIWMKTRVNDCSLWCRTAVLFILLAVLVGGLSALSAKPIESKDAAFSEAALAELIAAKKPVLVDATAAWCITCQVNKKIAIDTKATQAALRETNTIFMVADWTNKNPEITAFLKRFGYNGVPLVVYFPVDGEPVVLPQILSEELVIKTLKGENK